MHSYICLHTHTCCCWLSLKCDLLHYAFSASRMCWQESLLAVSVHTPLYSHPLHYSQNLHWLPIEWRVHFKLATLAYKALHTGQPPTLPVQNIMNPARNLRSSSSFQLCVPRYKLEFGSHAFRISARKFWNLLTASIRNSPSLPTYFIGI